MQFGQLNRREFVTLLGGATAWPVAARAQQDQRMRRIGMLVNGPETYAEMVARIAAFRNGLQDLGWVPGTNLQLEQIRVDFTHNLHA